MYKILVATDGSDSSFRAMEKVAEMAPALEAHVTVISVAQLVPVYRAAGHYGAYCDGELIAILEKDIEAAAKEVLKRAKDMFSERGIEVEIKMEKGNPADLICQEATSGQYDLVVVGSRGLGGIKELIMGSVSSRVAHFAKTAVMIVK